MHRNTWNIFPVYELSASTSICTSDHKAPHAKRHCCVGLSSIGYATSLSISSLVVSNIFFSSMNQNEWLVEMCIRVSVGLSAPFQVSTTCRTCGRWRRASVTSCWSLATRRCTRRSIWRCSTGCCVSSWTTTLLTTWQPRTTWSSTTRYGGLQAVGLTTR